MPTLPDGEGPNVLCEQLRRLPQQKECDRRKMAAQELISAETRVVFFFHNFTYPAPIRTSHDHPDPLYKPPCLKKTPFISSSLKIATCMKRVVGVHM